MKLVKRIAIAIAAALLMLGAAIGAAEATADYRAGTAIHEDAPVKTRQSIVIQAPPERVWRTLSAIDQWPTWQPDVARAHLEGPLRAGSVFTWSSGGFPIRSTLQTVEPNARIGWSGRAFGAFAIHTWRLAARADGRTEVLVEESMEGWLISLLRGTVQRELTSATARWLGRLKGASEA